MLETLIPFQLLLHDWQNPLFRLMARRERPAVLLRAFFRRAAALILVICGTLWIFGVLSSPYSQSGGFTVLWWLTLASFAANHALELRCLAATMGALNDEITRGRMELLVVSNLRSGFILDALYRIAQVRVWRWVTSIIVLRLVIVALMILQSLLPDPSTGRSSLFTILASDGFGIFILVVFVPSFCYAFLRDPLWHSRAFLALGLVVSSRTRQINNAALILLPLVVLIWIVQAVITIVLPTMLSIFGLMCLGFVAAPLLSVFLLRLLYTRIEHWGLAYAENHLFHQD